MTEEKLNSPLAAGGSVIILAGGLGTRLRSVVPDLPKCMAPVNGKPFLSYVVDHFIQQGVEKFIFSLGYKHEVIIEYLEVSYPLFITDHLSVSFQYSIENEPLGTGGAIKKACTFASAQNLFVANGDTLFIVDTSTLLAFHTVHDADCTLSLKPLKDFSRYGVIDLNEDRSIKNFSEKKHYAEGLVNGGVYVLNVSRFLHESLPEKFSFETDYLQAQYTERKMYGLVQDSYFIDIGIPEDYERAQEELGSLDS